MINGIGGHRGMCDSIEEWLIVCWNKAHGREKGVHAGDPSD